MQCDIIWAKQEIYPLPPFTKTFFRFVVMLVKINFWKETLNWSILFSMIFFSFDKTEDAQFEIFICQRTKVHEWIESKTFCELNKEVLLWQILYRTHWFWLTFMYLIIWEKSMLVICGKIKFLIKYRDLYCWKDQYLEIKWVSDLEQLSKYLFQYFDSIISKNWEWRQFSRSNHADLLLPPTKRKIIYSQYGTLGTYLNLRKKKWHV